MYLHGQINIVNIISGAVLLLEFLYFLKWVRGFLACAFPSKAAPSGSWDGGMVGEAFPVQLPRATAAQFPIAPFWRGGWRVSCGERSDSSRLAGGARQGRASSLARPVRKQAGQREEHGGAGAGASAPEAAARRLLRGASCTPGERTPTARAPFALHC